VGASCGQLQFCPAYFDRQQGDSVGFGEKMH
jgi:hypothetical protein